MNPRYKSSLVALALVTVAAVPANAQSLQSAGTITADAPTSSPRVKTMVLAAQRWWTFLSTGDETLIRAAAAETFHDNTLPPGRTQGRDGAVAAFRAFRQGSPDLKCVIAQTLVVRDMVHARGTCSGTLTGTFLGTQGTGQKFSFAAADTYRIVGGRIVEDWHMEDYLTFFSQIGLVSMPGAKPTTAQ